MKRRVRPLPALVTGLFFVGVGIGGSAPVSETPSATGGSPMSLGQLSGEAAPVAPATPLPSGGVALASAADCPVDSGVATASSLQSAIRKVNSPDWLAADGGISARLGDGRTMWMFGDTSRSEGVVAANSLLLSDGACFEQYLGPSKGAVIPDDGSSVAPVVTWPTAISAVDRGGWSEVIVFGNRVRRGKGLLDFTLLGTSLSRFAVPNGGAPRLLEVRGLTSDEEESAHITWGTSTAMDGQWVYIYGTQVVRGSLGREVYVARARWDDLPYAAQWQYYGPTGWADDTSARPILSSSPGASHILSVFPRRGSWYIVSKAGGDLGNDVGVWKASTPTGPFRLVKRISRPYAVSGDEVRYMPLAHSQFTADKDVIVSMSRNVTSTDAAIPDASAGRPEFFDVTLP